MQHIIKQLAGNYNATCH